MDHADQDRIVRTQEIISLTSEAEISQDHSPIYLNLVKSPNEMLSKLPSLFCALDLNWYDANKGSLSCALQRKPFTNRE